MDFKTFKANVERWAEVRGIYEQSTEEHQQAKALEEIGEYLTSKTDEERMDAIGDIAVCIVNAANFSCLNSEIIPSFNDDLDGIGDVAYCIIDGAYSLALGELSSLSFSSHGILFELCIEKAWNEIKDRKGMMVDGFYVKWENLNEQQREEFKLRDSNNTLLRQ